MSRRWNVLTSQQKIGGLQDLVTVAMDDAIPQLLQKQD
jgi:hypothetical protein